MSRTRKKATSAKTAAAEAKAKRSAAAKKAAATKARNKAEAEAKAKAEAEAKAKAEAEAKAEVTLAPQPDAPSGPVTSKALADAGKASQRPEPEATREPSPKVKAPEATKEVAAKAKPALTVESASSARVILVVGSTDHTVGQTFLNGVMVVISDKAQIRSLMTNGSYSVELVGGAK